MSEFVIDTSSVTFKDQEGNVLVEGCLLDLHFTIAEVARKSSEIGLNNEETYTEVAGIFMEKFQGEKKTDLSWATAMKISIEIQKKIGDEKKS